MSVRCAQDQDLPALLALEEASFDADRLAPRQWRRHLHNPRAWIGLIDDQGLPCACIVLLFRADSRAARIYSIAVSQHSRGRGYARELLQAAAGEALRRGAMELRLEVRADNAAARSLYEAQDFVAFAQRGNYYQDGMAAVRYRKRLQALDT